MHRSRHKSPVFRLTSGDSCQSVLLAAEPSSTELANWQSGLLLGCCATAAEPARAACAALSSCGPAAGAGAFKLGPSSPREDWVQLQPAAGP